MKVTPIDIRHKEFRRAMRGYSEEEVDLFLDEVADDFEVLFKENIELQDEIHRLKDQVAQYDNLKETLQKTLISAQQQADGTRANARKESELILRDAELQARNIIAESYTEKQKVQQSVAQLRQAEDDFRFKFRSLLEAHLNLLMEDEASDDRRRFREAANGTADQTAEDDTASREATVLIAPETQPPGEGTAPAAPGTSPPVAAEAVVQSEIASLPPQPVSSLPGSQPVAEAGPGSAEVPAPASAATVAPAAPPAEAALPGGTDLAATVAIKPKASVTEKPAADEERGSAPRVGEGPPSWLASVSSAPSSPAGETVSRLASRTAAPVAAGAPQTAPVVGGTTESMPSTEGSGAGRPAAAGGGAEQDASVFDDFDDFDFVLPEDPDSSLADLGADRKPAKRESPVRRFLFGPKNAPRPGRPQDERDDRDFDW